MFFDKKIIKLGIDASSNTEVIKMLAQALEEKNIVKQSYLEHVLKRENNFPTGLQLEDNVGVALPHTDSEYVNESQIAVATLKHPVPFKNMVNASQIVNVDLIFMIAMSQPHEQAQLLSNLMTFCQNKKAVRELLETSDNMAAYKILKKYQLS